jgi:hypothetical protein
MFVKHIIKTLHISVTIVWPSSGGRLSCLVLLLLSLLVCVVYLVCGCNVVYVCACLMYLSVGRLVVNCLTLCISICVHSSFYLPILFSFLGGGGHLFESLLFPALSTFFFHYFFFLLFHFLFVYFSVSLFNSRFIVSCVFFCLLYSFFVLNNFFSFVFFRFYSSSLPFLFRMSLTFKNPASYI